MPLLSGLCSTTGPPCHSLRLKALSRSIQPSWNWRAVASSKEGKPAEHRLDLTWSLWGGWDRSWCHASVTVDSCEHPRLPPCCSDQGRCPGLITQSVQCSGSQTLLIRRGSWGSGSGAVLAVRKEGQPWLFLFLVFAGSQCSVLSCTLPNFQNVIFLPSLALERTHVPKCSVIITLGTDNQHGHPVFPPHFHGQPHV